MITTDKNNPFLDKVKSNGQNEAYLVLSDEERSKGFVRPLRMSYKHVGIRPQYPLRDLTESEKIAYPSFEYIKFEEYPRSESPIAGRFWTKKDLNSGCGTITTMALPLCETYARNPKFYGSTFCCGCGKHICVNEFIWTEDGVMVGA